MLLVVFMTTNAKPWKKTVHLLPLLIPTTCFCVKQQKVRVTYTLSKVTSLEWKENMMWHYNKGDESYLKEPHGSPEIQKWIFIEDVYKAPPPSLLNLLTGKYSNVNEVGQSTRLLHPPKINIDSRCAESPLNECISVSLSSLCKSPGMSFIEAQ